MSGRRYRMTRLGARAVTLVAFSSMILIGVEAAARAQQAGGQPEGSGSARVVVAPGVTVSGVRVGGMTAEEARDALAREASHPLAAAFRSEAWRFAPQTLGAHAAVEAAARAALRSPPGASLALDVQVDGQQLRRWSRSFAKTFDQKPRDAAIVLRGLRPDVVRARFGRRLSGPATRAAARDALEAFEHEPLQLAARVLRPRVTGRELGLAIVIRRTSNRLILYRPGGPKGMRVERKFGVATGQAAYPTPLGSFEIVDKQANPWWYPPNSAWAAGEEPIPPGPGNPLGTRWMGLSAPAVGIHGTPDSASIGYSASHGCIRMLVPEAEWLFERVEKRTPVYIVDA